MLGATAPSQEGSQGRPPSEAERAAMPFPQRFAKKKEEGKFQSFLEHMKKVHINLPLLEALREMPGYVKFLKQLISQKRKFELNETVNLMEECSAVVQKKMPRKRQDPGCFTIACEIGDRMFDQVLCDSGASINLMPLSIYRKLKIGNIKPTTITLQMADRTLSYPKGIVEDVLVRVKDFILPVDFVVLDMEEDKNVPLILGRSFLATAGALIDVQKGELTLRVNGEEATFSICRAAERAEEVDQEECQRLEDCEGSKRSFEERTALEKVKLSSGDGQQFEGITPEGKEKKVPKLPPPPAQFRYTFLGSDGTHPILVPNSMSKSELEDVMKEYLNRK